MSLWSKAQSRLPANIVNFTTRYLNYTLATKKNLSLWDFSATSDCSFVVSLSHSFILSLVATRIKMKGVLHNSALNFLTEALQTVQYAKLYVDLPGYLSPCIITGNNLRPDILLSTADNILYIIELTVAFESNLNNNAHRKAL